MAALLHRCRLRSSQRSSLPAIVAGLVGFFIFRNRVRGVYFSIITQALAWGAFLAFSRNEMLLGGTNGLTNFYKPLNSQKPLDSWPVPADRCRAGWKLSACFVAVTRSRLGRVLSRSATTRRVSIFWAIGQTSTRRSRSLARPCSPRWEGCSTCRRTGSSRQMSCESKTRSGWSSGLLSAGAAGCGAP